MANNYWIKLYHEILDDPKMGRLSDSAYRRCIELFLMAGRDGNDDGSLPDFDDIAWKLRVSNDQLQKDLAELEAAEIVCFVDGKPFVTNFAKRQARISNAEKQKAYRERKRLEDLEESDEDDTESLPESYESVTDGNADKIRIDKEESVNAPAPAHLNGFSAKWTQPYPKAKRQLMNKLGLLVIDPQKEFFISEAADFLIGSTLDIDTVTRHFADRDNGFWFKVSFGEKNGLPPYSKQLLQELRKLELWLVNKPQTSKVDEVWENFFLPATRDQSRISSWPKEYKNLLRSMGGQSVFKEKTHIIKARLKDHIGVLA